LFKKKKLFSQAITAERRTDSKPKRFQHWKLFLWQVEIPGLKFFIELLIMHVIASQIN